MLHRSVRNVHLHWSICAVTVKDKIRKQLGNWSSWYRNSYVPAPHGIPHLQKTSARKEVSTNKHLISDSKILSKIKNKLKRKARALDCADPEKLQKLHNKKRILIFRMSITILGRGLRLPCGASLPWQAFLKRESCKQLPPQISGTLQVGSFAAPDLYQNRLAYSEISSSEIQVPMEINLEPILTWLLF